MTQVYDVIVVGAGAAGVAALSRMFQAGLRVLGLEANDRLGGRIYSVPFAENVIDLGAQWCHGEKNNAVYELVKEMDVLGRPGSKKKMFFSSEEKISDTEANKYSKICLSIMKTGKIVDYKSKESLEEFIRFEFKKHLDLEDNPKRDTAEEVLEWFLKSIQAKMSTNELLDKSLNGLKESWDNEGEMWLNWKGKGFKTIIDILLKKHPDPSKSLPINILLNKEVVNIKWGCSQKGGVNITSPVQISCRDGSLYVSRHAVVTLSLGILKERYEALFTPSIPDSKILSIRGLAMCTMNKIYIRFPEQWWPENSMSFELLWKNEDKNQFIDEDSWMTQVYSFSTVENQPLLLCAWVTGTAAENMELQSTCNVQDGIYRLIKYFIGKAYNIPPPIDIWRSTWYTNSLARGSFSYRSIETECLRDAGAKELSKPLTDSNSLPIVCFAGEATSHHFHSTVHGAVESGFREADRLISILK